MEEKLIKIGEIAAFFGVSVKAVRIYEKKGILVPAKIDHDTGYRYYTPNQVQTLNALLDLKGLGFSLDEIKDIMAGKIEGESLVAAMKRKRIKWQDAISVAESKIDSIDQMAGRICDSKEAAKLHELTEDERAWLLVKLVCVEDFSGRNVLSEALWL